MKRFIRQSLFAFKSLFGYMDPKSYMLMKVIDPVLQMIYFSLLFSFVHKGEDITPWVIGSSFLLCIRSTIFGMGISLIGERYNGTLKLIIASPGSKFKVFISRGVFYMIDACISVLIGITVGFLLFGLRIPLDKLGLFLLAVCISMFASISLGLCISVFGLLTRDIHLFLNTVAKGLFLLTGALFPISQLPRGMAFIGNLLPMTRSIKAARIISLNGYNGEIFNLLAQEVFIGIIYTIIGYFLLRYLERLAATKATVEAY